MELTVTARIPSRSAAAIWLRMSASSGLIRTVGPGALAAHQGGREEVHGALAPSGALDAEHAPAPDDEIGHRVELVLAEDRVRTRELAQQFEGF